MTKTKATPEALTDNSLDEISGGPIFVKIPGLPGDVRTTSFEPLSDDGKVSPADALVVINR